MGDGAAGVCFNVWMYACAVTLRKGRMEEGGAQQHNVMASQVAAAAADGGATEFRKTAARQATGGLTNVRLPLYPRSASDKTKAALTISAVLVGLAVDKEG
jgi:hypothetical protein